MKKITLLVVLVCLGLGGFAQNFVEEFEMRYADNENFSVVNISSKMFELIAMMADEKKTDSETKVRYQISADGELDVQKMVSKLKGMKVLTSEVDARKYYDAAVKDLTKSGSVYEELMNVKEKKEWVRIYTREKKGTISELVMVILDENEFVLIGFTGEIDLKQISGIAEMVNVKGAEQLKKIDENK